MENEQKRIAEQYWLDRKLDNGKTFTEQIKESFLKPDPMENNSWQKCPKCNGTGVNPIPSISNQSLPKCPVCEGRYIISTISGKPPQDIYVAPCNHEWKDILQSTLKQCKHCKNVSPTIIS